MDVEKERQKTYYRRSRCGPSYKVEKEVLVFDPMAKRAKQENLLLSIMDHTQ